MPWYTYCFNCQVSQMGALAVKVPEPKCDKKHIVRAEIEISWNSFKHSVLAMLILSLFDDCVEHNVRLIDSLRILVWCN